MSDTEAEVVMSEELFDAHLNVAHWSGRAAALEGFASLLRKQSGDLFARGYDHGAEYYRDVANLANGEAKKERERHTKERAELARLTPAESACPEVEP